MSRKGILSISIFLISVIAGCSFAALWSYHNLEARLLFNKQPLIVSLPDAFPVEAKILDDLDIVLNTTLNTVVPVNQTISIPIHETLHVDVAFDHDVPIVMNVPINAMIPVEQLVHVDSKVRVTILGQKLNLPVKGDVLIKTDVPLNIEIPINQQMRMKFTAPADVQLKEALNIPLKADIHANIPIHSALSVPVRSALKAEIILPPSLNVELTHADMMLPLNTVTLSKQKNKSVSLKKDAAVKTKESQALESSK